MYCLRSPKVYKSYGAKIPNDVVTEFINITLELFEVIPEDKKILHSATNNSLFSDKEDSIQYECAKEIQADLILTSNIKDFKNAGIPVMTPEQFCNKYSRFFN